MQGIGFENMKVFKENQWFDFKDITLLTGTNNSGKSSIINAMQMLQENIKATNIDELIRTKFKITSHQNKFGSIETFVNNESKGKEEYFVYVRRMANIEYRIKIQVNKGLESYGTVKTIQAIDLKTNVEIFVLEVKNPYPDYQCLFNINYKYFVDRFYEKCRNTEPLLKKKVELDNLFEQVNDGKISIKEFEKFARTVEREFSVYINIRCQEVEEGSDKIYYTYSIDFYKFNGFLKFNSVIDEINVIVGGDEACRFSISEQDYYNFYAQSYRNGIFDFSLIWRIYPSAKIEFENLICSYYKKDIEQSYKLLCNDLITVLSHSSWEMKSKGIWNDAVNINVTKKFYLDSIPDFGLIGSLVTETKNSDESDAIRDRGVMGKIKFDFPALSKLNYSIFKERILSKLSPIIIKSYNANNFIIGDIIPHRVYREINSEIIQKIEKLNFGLNNIYVSSNRFTSKRAFSFNDNTDFTNLLKQIEKLSVNDKLKYNAFINKWIKEFEIADELVLKPDLETGNFKTYLKNGETETLLADYGLGTNQLLPIIFSLGIHSYYADIDFDNLLPRTVVIEEPEANLHPAMQSKLADLFADAAKKFKVKIIAETHSEYLIRKLQYLVASDKSEVKPEDISLYYFYKPNHPDVLSGKANQVEKIMFDKHGRLNKEFGSGFFDEADNIATELFLLSHPQSN